MLRTAHRLFSSSLRSSTRTSLNTTARQPRTALARRMMSSESHASHGSSASDRSWIIGSALVFGPLFLYLVSPSARKSSHGHTDHAHQGHGNEHEETKHAARQHDESHRGEVVKPIADDEGTKVSSEEVKESMEKAFEADSPKDAQEQEGIVAKAEMTTVRENLASGAQSPTDATSITESEPKPTPTAPVEVDEATNAISNEKVQSTDNEPITESKA